jgi:hypothetical protein
MVRMMVTLQRRFPLGASILEVCINMDQLVVSVVERCSSTVLTAVGLSGVA